ncbi:hypothetical protein [Tessaracoccus defluvii]|uniref:hypothetical protein n=1 Tax=Tessaracoccus defluvii TaxID=1285901 RepID=UPI001D0372A5|nr:hypothetical protein [Tessaracoccus defluvii]
MSEFLVEVDADGDAGRLRWGEQEVDLATLSRAVSLASDDALVGRGLRRLQVELPAWDAPARTALHRAGFRLEGRLRSVIERPRASTTTCSSTRGSPWTPSTARTAIRGCWTRSCPRSG